MNMKRTLVILAALLTIAAVGSGKLVAPFGVTLMSASGPTLKSGTGSPNGSVTAPKGSVYLRTDTAEVYQNADGSTAWARLNPSTSFSNGDDGSLTCFDGTSVCAGLTPVSGEYTLNKDLMPSVFGCSGGLTTKIREKGFRIFVNGPATGDCTIHNNGSNASGATGGAATTSGFCAAVAAGGNGATVNNGGFGGTGLTAPAFNGWASNSTANGGSLGGAGATGQVPAKGGGGGSTATHTGGGGGQITVNNANIGAPTLFDIRECHSESTNTFTYGTGGGGGGGDGTGGGGGAGGGPLIFEAQSISGTFAFQANGGNGAAGVSGNGGGGGGGGGGVAHVGYNWRSGAWTVIANGGLGGTHVGTAGDGAVGANGKVDEQRL